MPKIKVVYIETSVLPVNREKKKMSYTHTRSLSSIEQTSG